jgi:hypothetical protein
MKSRDYTAIRAALAFAGCLVFGPAFALDFSPNCQIHQQLQVPGGQVILFTKQPVPHPNGTASAHDLIGLETYVIPAQANSCVVAHPPADGTYCFIAWNDQTLLSVGMAAIRDPGGLTACH